MERRGDSKELGGDGTGTHDNNGLGGHTGAFVAPPSTRSSSCGLGGLLSSLPTTGVRRPPHPRHQPLRVTFSMQLARLFLPLPLGRGLRTGSGQAGAPPGGRRPLSRCCECSSIPGAPPPITDQPISPRDGHSKAPGLLGVGCGPGQGGPGTAPGDLPLLPAALSNLLPKAKPAATQDTLG